MDIKTLNIIQEAEESKYSPKYLLKAYAQYFKKLSIKFRLEPGETKDYRKRFAAFFAQEDKLAKAIDMAPGLKKMVKISEQQVKDIQRGKNPRGKDEYARLNQEFMEKSDYILNFKSDRESFRDLVKSWWIINKKRILARLSVHA